MSRTRRHKPEWSDDPKLTRDGKVPVPLSEYTRSLPQSVNEVWTPKAKKFAKKMEARKNRRKNKKLLGFIPDLD